jgi:hypothetical protein
VLELILLRLEQVVLVELVYRLTAATVILLFSMALKLLVDLVVSQALLELGLAAMAASQEMVTRAVMELVAVSSPVLAVVVVALLEVELPVAILLTEFMAVSVAMEHPIL